MLKSLRSAFTTPEVNRCPDGHFRRTIYGAGPYIGDYPEQCMLSCIVQGWCPKYVTNDSCLLIKLTICSHRCMASSKDLEKDALRRTQKLVDSLAQFHELGELWAQFGIVGDIVVRAQLFRT